MGRVDGLEGQIRDCANKLEDFLEFHELKLLEEGVSGDEGVMREEVSSFSETAKRMENEYMEELSREDDDDGGDVDDDDDAEDGNDDEDVIIDFGVEMVGHSIEFENLRGYLLGKMRPVDTCVYSYFGEEGTGRTIIARTVYEDLSKCRGEYFDCWAWVTVGVGPNKLKQVLISIIAQVVDDDDNVSRLDESELSSYLNKALENRRYMIGLGDVDDAELVDYLKRASFLDQRNGSLVLITTASKDVAELADIKYLCDIPARIFEETTWPVVRSILLVFASISPEMEEAGKQIIKNCRCLAISYVKIILFLLKTDNSFVEEWRKIAADIENPIFMVTNEISEISKIKAEIQSWDRNDKRRKLIAKGLSSMVDFSDKIEESKNEMQPKRLFSNMQILSLWGMAGIGKTKFVRNFFKDKSILRHFDHHVWITLGQKYQTKDIFLDILAQIYPNIDKLHMKGDDKFARDLCVQASNKRCFIVLDDLCSKDPLLHLKYMFPDVTGTTLVTTRISKVADYEKGDDKFFMELLDEEESWCLLRQKVFAGESCPPELEKAGRVIAEKCDGLPLLILTVADQLLKVEISEEYWNHVASGKEKLVFKNAHHQISEALLPSYQSLPQHLKPCFLYMGIFLKKYEIQVSNLTNHLISEGFMEHNSHPIEEDFVIECLSELAERSLAMIDKTVFGTQINRCRHHSIFWHLSNSQAMKNKFFNVVNSYNDSFTAIMESQRRLCIRNSVLLSIKDVKKSLASNTSANSLQCVGLFQQFPVPLNFDLKLLRVMNALPIRLYEFPNEVVRLVLLRYLRITCNGKLPALISNFRKLQYLIVKQYMNIKSAQNSLQLPVEIWEIKELKHLEIMGGRLPNHTSGAGLLKLTSLLDVSVETCTKKVLRGIPNLKRLGIRIELAPGDEGDYSFRCLNLISRLRRLESLKCEVVNPHLRSAPPPVPLSMFPRSLKKLSLSGLGYPLEYMSIIGRLDNLQVLKLKHCAFIGPKWEINIPRFFKKLEYLLVEDTNLVHWRVNSVTQMSLEHLCIKDCYKLQELPIASPIRESTQIEIVDCSSSTVAWAKYVGEALCENEPKIRLSWTSTKKD